MKSVVVMLIFTLGLISTNCHAEDPETAYLPAFGRDVTQTHPERAEIQTLVAAFVKAMAAKDKTAFHKLVTADFREGSRWDKAWGDINSTLSPDLIRVEDFFIMNYKNNLYVRFSVRDRNSGKLFALPTHTWYQVVNSGKEWKMQAYDPDFEPDNGP